MLASLSSLAVATVLVVTPTSIADSSPRLSVSAPNARAVGITFVPAPAVRRAPTPGIAPDLISTKPSDAAGTVLQMNLCLSGFATCYVPPAYAVVLHEAAHRVRHERPAAVTLNETCSGDAADLASRTGYRTRFTAVHVTGARLRCVTPGDRGVFGIAVLTKAPVRTSTSRPFSAQHGPEQRRWLCAATTDGHTVCTAHLGTRGSARERRVNDAQCAELRGVLARHAEAAATVFGGDLNRHRFCAPAAMRARADTQARQKPGIQHVYGSRTLPTPTVRVIAAAHTDHDFLLG